MLLGCGKKDFKQTCLEPFGKLRIGNIEGGGSKDV
jgi:hypothetical protein|tara:strand:+ start:835 stop:939 length:105 start_codon:yes stop_codon:yes gene_type:complete